MLNVRIVFRSFFKSMCLIASVSAFLRRRVSNVAASSTVTVPSRRSGSPSCIPTQSCSLVRPLANAAALLCWLGTRAGRELAAMETELSFLEFDMVLRLLRLAARDLGDTARDDASSREFSAAFFTILLTGIAMFVACVKRFLVDVGLIVLL